MRTLAYLCLGFILGCSIEPTRQRTLATSTADAGFITLDGSVSCTDDPSICAQGFNCLLGECVEVVECIETGGCAVGKVCNMADNPLGSLGTCEPRAAG